MNLAGYGSRRRNALQTGDRTIPKRSPIHDSDVDMHNAVSVRVSTGSNASDFRIQFRYSNPSDYSVESRPSTLKDRPGLLVGFKAEFPSRYNDHSVNLSDFGVGIGDGRQQTLASWPKPKL